MTLPALQRNGNERNAELVWAGRCVAKFGTGKAGLSRVNARVEVVGTDDFVDRVLVDGCRLNYQQEKAVFRLTDDWQHGRYGVLEYRYVRAALGDDDRDGPQRREDIDDEVPTRRSSCGPCP